jgi:hypothetical protein
MQENKQIVLIDLLDGRLTGEELVAAEQLLAGGDKESTDYFSQLQLAKEAVQYAALYDQVAAVKAQFSQSSVTTAPKAIVRPMIRNVFRAAAVLVLLIGAGIVYKYVTTSSTEFYTENYSTYDLSTARGDNPDDNIDELYRERKWSAVINQFNAAAVKDNKHYFLAGVANMELKDYKAATGMFQHIMAENARLNDDLFQDQAEYYLALTYIADNQPDKAVAILRPIKADKNHLYHQKVSAMSWLDLNILEIKKK